MRVRVRVVIATSLNGPAHDELGQGDSTLDALDDDDGDDAGSDVSDVSEGRPDDVSGG